MRPLVAALLLTASCAHLKRPIISKHDQWTHEVVRYIEPMQMVSSINAGAMEFTIGYRMPEGQVEPDDVTVYIGAGQGFFGGTNAAGRWHVQIDGKKEDWGEFALDQTSQIFTGNVTLMSLKTDRATIERLAAAKKVIFHFENKDITLTRGNLESIQGLVESWRPGYKEWKPPRRF